MPTFSTAEARSKVKKSISAVSSGVGSPYLCKIGSGRRKKEGKGYSTPLHVLLLLTSVPKSTVHSVGRKPLPCGYFTST